MNAAIYLATQIAGVPGHTAQYGALAFDTVALVLYIQLDAPVGTNWVPTLPHLAKSIDVPASFGDTTLFDGLRIACVTVTAGSAVRIKSIANGFNGRELTVINVGVDDIIFDDQEGSIPNQIKMPPGFIQLTLSTDQSMTLAYDGTDGFWHLRSTTGTLS